MVDELLGQVLVRGNLLLAEVVGEGLPLVHVDYHDLLASRRMLGQWSVAPAPGWMAREARGRRHPLVLERE
jgi:hypothetical protein